MNTMRVFGYVNCAYFNLKAEGDIYWFASKESRDQHLLEVREEAVTRGLSEGSSEAGIYPIYRDLDEEEDLEWWNSLVDRQRSDPGERFISDEDLEKEEEFFSCIASDW